MERGRSWRPNGTEGPPPKETTDTKPRVSPTEETNGALLASSPSPLVETVQEGTLLPTTVVSKEVRREI